jgi:peptidoglycan/LPS O-acetylase OafA/YrhL
VLTSFAKRPFRRRLIALLAVYAIALSGLIASFGGASAAATDLASNSAGILCHSAGGQTSPTDDQTNSKICIESCCVGCLMLMATLPPPPASAFAIRQTASKIVHSLAVAALTGTPAAKSHRSRAPPYGA